MLTARTREGEGNSGLALEEKSREKRGLVDYISTYGLALGEREWMKPVLDFRGEVKVQYRYTFKPPHFTHGRTEDMCSIPHLRVDVHPLDRAPLGASVPGEAGQHVQPLFQQRDAGRGQVHRVHEGAHGSSGRQLRAGCGDVGEGMMRGGARQQRETAEGGLWGGGGGHDEGGRTAAEGDS